MRFSYDAANRHVGTTYDDGTTVTIVRDATGRIVSRTTDPAGAAPASTTRYLFAAGGDVAWGQKAGTDLTRSIGLPGGVSWTNQAGTLTWSFPGLGGHGLIKGLVGRRVRCCCGTRSGSPWTLPRSRSGPPRRMTRTRSPGTRSGTRER
uniref:hypothetical protein n=1 Tax=Microbacterium hydrocarbonoxydans TaxID=273678 RepID=UPI0035ABBB5A